MGADSHDPKSLVLARRAKFIAAALAGVTGVATACGGSTESTKSNPEPCLGVDCCPEPPPQPCLTKVQDPPDADADADAATDASTDGDPDADDADAGPQPCLSPLPGDQ